VYVLICAVHLACSSQIVHWSVWWYWKHNLSLWDSTANFRELFNRCYYSQCFISLLLHFQFL